MRARFLLSEVGIGLRRNMTMTFAVVVTIAISLSLLGIGLLANAQVGAMKDYWYDKIEVSVFLCGHSLNHHHVLAELLHRFSVWQSAGYSRICRGRQCLL